MECNGCTLCCKLTAIPCMDSPPGDWCRHCIIGKGCNIWNTDIYPNDCKIYECSYKQSKCSTDLRPDKIKMLFEKVSDDIFFGSRHPDYDLTDIAKKQIGSFVKQGFSIVISDYINKSPNLYLAKGHIAEQVKKTIIVRARQAYDSTIIHN